MRNAKIVFVTMALVVAFIFGGCATRPTFVGVNEDLAAAERSAAAISAINDELARILHSYDEFIARELGAAITGIDLALYLLDQYEEFVRSLVQRVSELIAQLYYIERQASY
jgi:hypothetical protein